MFASYCISIQWFLPTVGALLAIAALLGIRLFKVLKMKEEAEFKYRQLEGKMNMIQIETLESKLDQHLFKNILNSIQSHAFQTYFALDKLSNVLDYILYDSRNKFITPKEEIEFALSLIEINKIKVSPLFDLNVKTHIKENEPMYQRKVLAPLITINLIENAFKHSDLQSADAFISIAFEFSGNTFHLTVANKISGRQPMRKEKGGIGLETLKKRLQILHNNNFRLESFAEGEVYTTHLKIYLSENPA